MIDMRLICAHCHSLKKYLEKFGTYCKFISKMVQQSAIDATFEIGNGPRSSYRNLNNELQLA